MPHFDFLCKIPVIRPKPKLLNCTPFDSVIEFFRKTVQDLPDFRTGDNTSYTIEDAALAAFSVFLLKVLHS